MTLHDITAGQNYRTLPFLPFADLTLLWHCDFWDGPQSGLLNWRGERYWFQVQEEYAPPEGDEAAYPWYRRFLVIRLTEQQLRDKDEWHELFRRCVGTHTDYRPNGDGMRGVGVVRPREQWAEFYDAYQQRTPPDLSRNEVVGWFEM